MASSRDKLVHTAIDLILTRGFNTTTVDEICARAEVAKGSFYYAFKSKEDLGVAALEAFDTEHNTEFANSGFLEEPDPKKRLNMFLNYLIDEAGTLFEKGCLLGNMSLEISDEFPKIRKRLDELFQQNLDSTEFLIGAYLESLKNPPSLSPKILAEKFASVLEGSLVLARASGDWDYLPRMLSLYRDELMVLSETK
ncbi:MAG: hypothetical protein CMO55_25925 [Verrucomicrobiales bacterium]|nr:hypothetical protein [Verrucomicrobiales bacterium]